MYLKLNAEMNEDKSMTVSPISPETPTSITSHDSSCNNYASIPHVKAELKRNKKICKVLRKIGLFKPCKLHQTLQGSIWRASQINDSSASCESVIIKVTDQDLYKKSMANVQGKLFRVNEDVLLEQSIVKYLSQTKDCPDSIIKFHRFFKSHSSFFFVMEDGGSSLFEFVQKAHRFLCAGRIDVHHWHQVVRCIFKQMVEAIEFMHSRNVSHFDISLENWLINDVSIDVVNRSGANKKLLQFDVDDIQIRLCDFGLAQLFTKRECMSNKFCGKQQYKSPEVVCEKMQFDAKKNDIWCAGMCLVLTETGFPPWKIADASDANYRFVMENSMQRLFECLDALPFVDKKLLDLFDGIFCAEKERMNIVQIREFVNTKWQ